MCIIQHNILPLVHTDVQRGESMDRPADHVQIPPPLVVALLGEEGAVNVALVVVDGAAAAVATREVNVVAAEVRDVGLGPGVLVATDHHARVVAPQKEEMLEGD